MVPISVPPSRRVSTMCITKAGKGKLDSPENITTEHSPLSLQCIYSPEHVNVCVDMVSWPVTSGACILRRSDNAGLDPTEHDNVNIKPCLTNSDRCDSVQEDMNDSGCSELSWSSVAPALSEYGETSNVLRGLYLNVLSQMYTYTQLDCDWDYICQYCYNLQWNKWNKKLCSVKCGMNWY